MIALVTNWVANAIACLLYGYYILLVCISLIDVIYLQI